MNTFSKNFEQYITMYADDLQYIAGEAYGWGDKETSGLVYGLFTQARRIMLSLAGPGGLVTSNQAARCSMDPDYTTWLNEYMLDNYGQACFGNWHSHGDIQMDHSSGGDVNQVRRLAGRENLETMVQLVLTRQKATNLNQKLIGFSNIKEKLLDGARLTAAEPSTKKERYPGNQENHSKMRVNAFWYPQAANGSHHRCRIKVLPAPNPFRKALADTGILDIPGKPRFEEFPFERIIYDEVRAIPGTATERYIPYILAKQLNELSDEISRQAEVCIYNEGQIVLSLPLSNNNRLSVTYAAKISPPRICSVSVFFQDTKTVIDLTNDVLVDDGHTSLSLIHRRVEDKVRASRIKRITALIGGRRYFASKFHKNKEIQ